MKQWYKKPFRCLVGKEKYESKFLRSLLHHWLAEKITAQQCEFLFEQKLSVERAF